ncbi:MAG: hypothetical protein GY801_43740 [bacterium]|nr:hypothetical protein [bacterium]
MTRKPLWFKFELTNAAPSHLLYRYPLLDRRVEELAGESSLYQCRAGTPSPASLATPVRV